MPPRAACGHSGGMQQAAQQTAPRTGNPAARLRVFVVEDSGLIRERVEDMVAQAGALVAGHAAGVATAIEGIRELRPDVVILDAQLADGTGFDVLRAIRRQVPPVDAYFFSNYSADAYRLYAVKLGAKGFFDKSSEFDQLRDLIARRAAGH